MSFWLAPLLVLAVVTVPLVVTDLTRLRLPNALLLPGYLVFSIAAALASLVGSAPVEPSPVFVCCVTFAGALAMRMIGAIGMGDVKLVALLAGCLQLTPHANALSPPMLAAGATGVLVAPAAIVSVTLGRRWIPLGPFLLAGFWVAVML